MKATYQLFPVYPIFSNRSLEVEVLKVVDLDLEELWQAVRCRFRRRRTLKDRLLWGLYSKLYQVVRTLLVSAARG